MKRGAVFILIVFMGIMMAACGAPAGGDDAANPPAVAPEETPGGISEPVSETKTVVTFTDPVLEELVRKAMGKPEGDITLAEAEEVIELDLNMEDAGAVARIKDISDLAQFPNIMYLNLAWAMNDGGKPIDISPLSGLTKLEALYMNCDSIEDVSALSGMTGMKDLKIWGNSITDISVLAGMPLMEDLWIQSNQITYVSALSGMTNLYRLYMADNQVTDVSPLSGLTGLTSLMLDGNPIEDYAPLVDIYPNLTEKDFEIE